MGILDDMANNADKEIDKFKAKTEQQVADSKQAAKDEVHKQVEPPKPNNG